MADFPLVPLPAGLKLPGVYTSVFLNAGGTIATPNNRLLIWGYMGSGASVTPYTPVQAISQIQVDAMCKSWSPLAHTFAAAVSQLPDGIGAEIYLIPIPEPTGGSKRAAKVRLLAKPTAGVTGTALAAAASDTCTLTYRGRSVKVSVEVNDTWAQIATRLNAAVNAVGSFPVTSTVATETLTLTERCKGAFDPGALQLDFDNAEASGCAASPGTMLFASAATASGSGLLKLGVGLASMTITTADTAIMSAQNAVATIRADAFQVDAAIPATPVDGTVTLYYRTGRPCRAISAALTGVTGQTLTVSCDTPGVGTPTISSALTRLTADETAYKAWALFFEDTSNLSSVVTHVENQEAAGTYEKGQMVFVGVSNGYNASDLATLDLANATTPKMTTSSRYVLIQEQGSPQASWELAARVAAEVAATAYQAQNFNSVRLKTNDSTPLGVPHKADRATRTEINTLIATYKMCPLAVDSGGYNFVWRSSTTYLKQGIADENAEKWSWRIAADYIRLSLRGFLWKRFSDKSLKRYGTPRTSHTVTLAGVKSAVVECLAQLDDQDVFDGVESIRNAILAGVKVTPTRIDIAAPLRVPTDIDQLAVALVQQ